MLIGGSFHDLGTPRIQTLQDQSLQNEAGLSTFLAEAAGVWKRLYSIPRNSKRRITGYGKRMRSASEHEPKPLQDWLQSRREAVACPERNPREHEFDTEALVVAAKDEAGDEWTDKQEKEIARQEGLLTSRKVDAARRGHLLQHEQSQEMTDMVAASEGAIVKRREARNRLELRLSQRICRPQFNLFGHVVWVQPGLLSLDSINKALLQHHMRRAQQDTLAVDLMVVSDVSNPGVTISAMAGMFGTLICSQGFFESGGSVGCAVAYEPAMEVRRSVFISPDFSRALPALTHILRRCFQERRSKWKQLYSLDEWLQYQLSHPKNSSSCWALLTPEEKAQHAALQRHQWALTVERFTSLILKVDHSRTALGIGNAA